MGAPREAFSAGSLAGQAVLTFCSYGLRMFTGICSVSRG